MFKNVFLALFVLLTSIEPIRMGLSHANRFQKYEGIDIIDKKVSIISSQNAHDRLDCISKCSFESICSAVAFYSNKTCYLFNDVGKSYLHQTNAKDDFLFYLKNECSKIPYDSNDSDGLVHFWPLGDSLADVIGGKTLSIKLNGAVTTDRFGNDNSALELNSGYGQFPIGSYFNPTGFSYMIWVKTLKFGSYQRIVEFGNQYPEDAITAFYFENGGTIGAGTSEIQSFQFCKSEEHLGLNKWFHVAVVSELSTVKLYIDAKEICSYHGPIRDVQRIYNFIGKSSDNSYPNVNAVFDDLKIFNRSLSINEIAYEKDKASSVRYGEFIFVLTSESYPSNLKNYWPIAGSTRDIISGKDLSMVLNGCLVDDRFGNQKSAIVFNHGYGQFPAGSYFNPNNYTYMLWVKPLSYNGDQRLINFGTGSTNYIATFFTSGKIASSMNSGQMYECIAADVLSINEWVHIAVVSESTYVKLFLNGVEKCAYTIGNYDNGFKTIENYIGKGYSPSDKLVHAAFDEIKFFGSALSANEVNSEMNRPQPYRILLNLN